MRNISLRSTFLVVYWMFYFAPATAFANEKHTDTESFAANIKTESHKVLQQLSDEFTLPSFSMAVAMNNEIVYANAVGFADIAEKIPATVDTQYSFGSVAKPMTGVALMRLVQSENIQLTHTLKQHIADLDPRFRPVTLKQLASHTAGIVHETPERDILEYGDISDHKSPFDAFSAFETHPLLFQPGNGFKYSSHGYIALSAAIESIAQQNFNSYLQEQVWTPLNMTQTRFDNSVNSDAREATYYESWNEESGYQLATTKRDRSFLFGAGGYMSTPSDMVRMASALYDDSYLSSDLIQQMLTPVTLESGEVNEQRYAIGWRIGQLQLSEQETLMVAHHGGITDKAATSYLLVIPEKKSAIAFVTNMVPPKFWQMRGKVARLLTQWLQQNTSNSESNGAQ